MNTEPEYLPIKVIITDDHDLQRPPPGFGKDNPKFLKRYENVRDKLFLDIEAIQNHFDFSFSESNLPVVARARLSKDAIAKSHRPEYLFNSKTCPIIGMENFDELLISVTPTGLASLKDAIYNSTNNYIKADAGKLLGCEPFTAKDALGGISHDLFIDRLRQANINDLKLRLFSHGDDQLNSRITEKLSNLMKSLKLPSPVDLHYGAGLRLYRIKAGPLDNIREIINYVGTQNLSMFQHFSSSPNLVSVGPMNVSQLPSPIPNTDYPVVGIFDSGTDKKNSWLQAWVVARDEKDVPPEDQDNKHGSMVAGLAISGKALNNGADGFPSGNAKVLDVVALSKTGATETDLMDTMRRAFQEYPNVKIWNLSVNAPSTAVVTERFSTFAMALDTLQDEFGVTIINSAGNYEGQFHKWPRPNLGEDDRITSPADSLRAITVGSQAHRTRTNAYSKIGEPSPFTRKGPGAAYLPKPEICHFGGNIDNAKDYKEIGILSTDDKFGISEGVGTSFAAPLIAATAAHISHAMDTQCSHNLLKALLIHHSVLHSQEEITAKSLPYRGFGRPPEPSDMLKCRPWESTLIFELNLPYNRRVFRKLDFPIPPCLYKDGKVFGKITMTLVYNPPVDSCNGAAYSKVNVDCSLGTCKINKDGKNEDYSRKILPIPKDFDDKEYEEMLIEHGFKWAPVKVYQRLIKKGLDVTDETWRVNLRMHTRCSESVSAQPVVLIATITDPDMKAPVYNEVIETMNRNRWQSQNLGVRAESRIRVR